ncbi:MAG: hypothetical protein ACLQBJ_05545 [Bryobacteraceae bacterium]
MTSAPRPVPPEGVPLLPVIRWSCAHPVELFIRRWNWKSAMFSALMRGGIFFTVNLKAGWRAAVGAMLVEFAWRTATSGGWGAVTQMLRKVKPDWQAVLGAMLVVPAVSHSIEFTIHYTRGTPVLARSILTSICFTQISNLFNLYAMRRGALIVGAEARPLGEDMKRVPALIGGFLLVLPRMAGRAFLEALRNEGA